MRSNTSHLPAASQSIEFAGPLGCLRAAIDALGYDIAWAVLPALWHRVVGTEPRDGIDFLSLQRFAERLGLAAEAYCVAWDELLDDDLPCIALLDDGRFVALLGRRGARYDACDVVAGPCSVSAAELTSLWSGAILCLDHGSEPSETIATLAAVADTALRRRQSALLQRLGASSVARTKLSEVYAGTDAGRAVCLKLVPFYAAEDSREVLGLNQELAIIERLAGNSHPNVVDVFAVDPSSRCYLMARVDGVGLDCLALPVAPARILTIMSQVISGLAHLHANGVVHRDLSARNVLVDHRDEAVIIDFGLAFEAGAAPSNPCARTPWFSAPEQWTGDALGFATDVFCLGLLAYYLATGEHPLIDRLNAESTANPYDHNNAVLEKRIAELPASLQPLVSACLSFDPGDRCSLAEAAALVEAAGTPHNH